MLGGKCVCGVSADGADDGEMEGGKPQMTQMTQMSTCSEKGRVHLPEETQPNTTNQIRAVSICEICEICGSPPAWNMNAACDRALWG